MNAAQRRGHRPLFATIDAVNNNPAMAAFQSRASNHWIFGTHSHSTVDCSTAH
jgi:hypothetical protein